MLALDALTGFVFIGVLYVLLPLATWQSLSRERTSAVTLWCAGGLLLAGALVLTALTREFKSSYVFELEKALYAASLLCRVFSLHLDLKHPIRKTWLLGISVTFFYVFISWVPLDAVLRAQLRTGLCAALAGYMVVLIVRVARLFNSHNAIWVAGSYAIVFFALVFRVVALVSAETSHLLNSDFNVYLLLFALLQSAAIGHLGYIGMMLDRTHQRHLDQVAQAARNQERQNLMVQISHLDRMQSAERISLKLAHEVNQPLTAVLSNAQASIRGIARGQLSSGQLSELMQRIVSDVQRVSQIVVRLRDFIRPVTPTQSAVDLCQVTRDAIGLIEIETKMQTVDLVTAHPLGHFIVAGDSVLLSQVLLNLLRNAVESVAAHGVPPQIRVTVEGTNEICVVRVLDGGPHLDSESLGKVGTPFFTTKRSGLGLGFSISRSLVEQYQGSLVLRNAVLSGKPQHGVEVIVTLPLWMSKKREPM